jgi:hypothetical protein
MMMMMMMMMMMNSLYFCLCQVSSGTSVKVQNQPAELMTATAGFGIPFTESTTAGTEVMTTSSPAIQELASSSVTASVEVETETTTTSG